ncbi:g625 [Coccomyxa viridis]|uniref:plastoquinol--plastocyanin reductase n=1 Tax=Coccomyxa viridis TaxID=1274662 RepID=A0ABP1FLJ7_9CHLO
MQSALVSSPVVGRPSFAVAQLPRASRASRTSLVTRAAAIAAEDVPDAAKRTTMNLLLLGAAALPVGYMAFGFIALVVPPKVAGAGGAQSAKDAAGNDVRASQWLQTHKPKDHSLVQGLRGDATYLVVTDAGEIEKYGINAVCTHLGCVVPWNSNENKFKCPCHGSQYNNEGKVVRGPAPLSLALAHANVDNDFVFLDKWTETDFRTGQQPWWS